MSDYPDNMNEKPGTILPSTATDQNEKVSHEPVDWIGQFAGNLLDRGDSIIYAIVGVCFFLAAIIALGYCFWNFWNTVMQLPSQPASGEAGYIADAIVAIISDLLLVLIIMEVMSTVIHYLKSHSTSLRPFLFIGIVSGVRGILSIGARLSVNTSTKPDEFNHAMIELGVNAAVILALGITLKLLGKLVED
ncbi:MAG: phosphate-starvation-inducible PsiE family protein [Ktedonobacteraceae bacterium]